jgi:hypothetical protein
MQRSLDCEQSFRLASLFDFVDRATIQRHRHRIRFIDARIVELPIDQNCDRD